MALSQGQIEMALDLFSDLGGLTTRKMFGGVVIYSQGQIFAAMMSDGGLQLKGAGEMIEAFETAGWTRWTYSRKGSDKVTAMPYWLMPDDLLDDPEAACAWARRALAAL